MIARAVSSRVEHRLAELLADPGTCPHGNPIPGSANRSDDSGTVRLADAQGPVQVRRVGDKIEEDLAAMLALESYGLIPGAIAEVVGGKHNCIELVGSARSALIPMRVARQTWVTPIS